MDNVINFDISHLQKLLLSNEKKQQKRLKKNEKQTGDFTPQYFLNPKYYTMKMYYICEFNNEAFHETKLLWA